VASQTLDVWHCLILAGVATGLLIATGHQEPRSEPALPDLPFHAHAGARRDLSDLSWWATDPEGRITAATARRILAAVATRSGPAADRLRSRLAVKPLPGPTTVLGLLDPLSVSMNQEAA